jgi:hypothetical protein
LPPFFIAARQKSPRRIYVAKKDHVPIRDKKPTPDENCKFSSEKKRRKRRGKSK